MKSDVDMLRGIAACEALADRLRRAFDRYVLQWKRASRLHQIARDRERQAILYDKYECVGGPLDGEVVRWAQPELSMYVPSGTYNHGADHRLHFEQLDQISFGGEDPEC